MNRERVSEVLSDTESYGFEMQQGATEREDDTAQSMWLLYREAIKDIAKKLNIDYNRKTGAYTSTQVK